ncbi:MAG TPA: HAD-IIIC family phosphatase, partial [Candidatus Omnitrophota bacterium]|nr:HAD-IIIC family phosphatase [Candidatus Omnitrophota bacterium]
AVPQEAQERAAQQFGANTVVGEAAAEGFTLNQGDSLSLDHAAEVIKRRLAELEQLYGRAPPELTNWNLVITTDLSLTAGNVAACSIDTATVYLHPYFFELISLKQIEILYHELITHIAKGISDENAAGVDTKAFLNTIVLTIAEGNEFFYEDIEETLRSTGDIDQALLALQERQAEEGFGFRDYWQPGLQVKDMYKYAINAAQEEALNSKVGDRNDVTEAVNKKQLGVFQAVKILWRAVRSNLMPPGAKAPKDPNAIHNSCFLCAPNMSPLEKGIRFYSENGRIFVALCNPFQILPDHITLVALQHRDQELEQEDIRFIIDLVSKAKGFRFTFNSDKAGASIPWHFHFHGTSEALPVESIEINSEPLIANGNLRISTVGGEWPILTYVLEGDHEALAETIYGLVQAIKTKYPGKEEGEKRAYNLLFSRGEDNKIRVYFTPRRQEKPEPYFKNAFGFSEMNGVIVCENDNNFTAAIESAVRQALQLCGYVNESSARGTMLLTRINLPDCFGESSEQGLPDGLREALRQLFGDQVEIVETTFDHQSLEDDFGYWYSSHKIKSSLVMPVGIADRVKETVRKYYSASRGVTNTYPLAVPQDMQNESDFNRRWVGSYLQWAGEAIIEGFALNIDNTLPAIYKRNIEELLFYFSRSKLSNSTRVRIVANFDLKNLMDENGNVCVATCSINDATIYLHPYFFTLNQTKQLEILYHELISHIGKKLSNEEEALSDTRSFIASPYLQHVSANSLVQEGTYPGGPVFEELARKVLTRKASSSGLVLVIKDYHLQWRADIGGWSDRHYEIVGWRPLVDVKSLALSYGVSLLRANVLYSGIPYFAIVIRDYKERCEDAGVALGEAISFELLQEDGTEVTLGIKGWGWDSPQGGGGYVKVDLAASFVQRLPESLVQQSMEHFINEVSQMEVFLCPDTDINIDEPATGILFCWDGKLSLSDRKDRVAKAMAELPLTQRLAFLQALRDMREHCLKEKIVDDVVLERLPYMARVLSDGDVLVDALYIERIHCRSSACRAVVVDFEWYCRDFGSTLGRFKGSANLLATTAFSCYEQVFKESHRLKAFIRYLAAGLRDSRFADTDLAKLARDFAGQNIAMAKCLVLDCDGVLWPGIVGESGVEGIQLTEEYLDFQRAVKNLKEQGVLLAINSKNNEADVLEMFENHPRMILHQDDFVIIKANWHNKAENMKAISEALSISLDSFVFIDDSAHERELVRGVCPEVTTLEFTDIKGAVALMLDIFSHAVSSIVTEEDRRRTELLHERRQREEMRASFDSLEEYYRALRMEICVRKGKENSSYIARIAQLTQRTNLFNLTSRRYSESNIEAFLNSKEFEVLSLELSDKFGNAGIVGVIILKKVSDGEWEIDTFCLSCRAIGFSVELPLMAEAFGFSSRRNLKGIYVPSGKNRLVARIYEQLCFRPISDSEGTVEFIANTADHDLFVEKVLNASGWHHERFNGDGTRSDWELVRFYEFYRASYVSFTELQEKESDAVKFIPTSEELSVLADLVKQDGEILLVNDSVEQLIGEGFSPPGTHKWSIVGKVKFEALLRLNPVLSGNVLRPALLIRIFTHELCDDTSFDRGSYESNFVVFEDGSRQWIDPLPKGIIFKANTPYPLAVPQEVQSAFKKTGIDAISTRVQVEGFGLHQYHRSLPLTEYYILKEILDELKGLVPQGPIVWNLIVTTDLSHTQGMVAACDIDTTTIYIHSYFFRLSLAKKFEIMYHELISHLVKGITDEDAAMRDTSEFLTYITTDPMISRIGFFEFAKTLEFFRDELEVKGGVHDFNSPSSRATMRAVIKHLNSVDTSNMSVMDMGSGTGVIALLAARKGVKYILATDPDQKARESTANNVEKLGFSQVVEVRDNSYFDRVDEEFDLVVFNVHKGSVEDMKDYAKSFIRSLESHLNPGGVGIISFPDELGSKSWDDEFIKEEELIAIAEQYGFKIECLATEIITEGLFYHSAYRLTPVSRINKTGTRWVPYTPYQGRVHESLDSSVRPQSECISLYARRILGQIGSAASAAISDLIDALEKKDILLVRKSLVEVLRNASIADSLKQEILEQLIADIEKAEGTHCAYPLLVPQEAQERAAQQFGANTV